MQAEINDGITIGKVMGEAIAFVHAGDNFESVGDAILSNFGVVWAVICAGIYLSIYLQGASNVFYRNGTTYDGTTPIAQPFKRTTEETAKLAFNATLINAEDEAL